MTKNAHDHIVEYRNVGLGETAYVAAVRQSGAVEPFFFTNSDATSRHYVEFLNAHCTGPAAELLERIEGCGALARRVDDLIVAHYARQVQRARSLAARQGFRLVKSRARSAENPTHGLFLIVTADTNIIEFGDIWRDLDEVFDLLGGPHDSANH